MVWLFQEVETPDGPGMVVGRLVNHKTGEEKLLVQLASEDDPQTPLEVHAFNEELISKRSEQCN